MRALLAVGVMVVVAIVTFNRAIGPEVDPDTPVITHSADPIKVLLPRDPGSDTISNYVYSALVDASKRSRSTLADDLRAMSENDDLLEWISTSGAARFRNGEAAALAYPVYEVTVATDRVTIVTATVELLPQYWNLGSSIAHEDGHALINTMLAEECGPVLVADLAASGRRGVALAGGVEHGLYELGDRAHGLYHGVVNGARSARHAAAARDAAQQVIGESC